MKTRECSATLEYGRTEHGPVVLVDLTFAMRRPNTLQKGHNIIEVEHRLQRIVSRWYIPRYGILDNIVT